MQLKLTFTFLGILYFTFVTSLPTSVLEDVKESELKSKKEKRARETNVGISRSSDQFSNSPTAIKRGNSPRIENWENKETLMNLSPSLYSTDDGQFEDDKTLLEYEKGYRYGANKEKFDKELENAVLKSELYENAPYYNQYRYFDERNDERKRKRRAIKHLRLNNRYKREIELTPEEVLTLLSLWENEWRNAQQDDYKPTWFRYESDLDDNRDNDIEQDDEDWLDTPVYPHASNRINQDVAQDNPNYFYEDKRGQWGRFAENKKKKFMVARKRNDPTRELRYLNGPANSKNDFYTLSQLLASSPREKNVPLYQRLIL